MSDDKAALRRTTPIGVADFPHLTRPDGKFAKGGAPTYTCRTFIAPDSKDYPAAVKLRDELDELYDRRVPEIIEELTEELEKKRKKVPKFEQGTKPWGTDEKRGIYFNPKMRAWYERDDEKIEMRPGVYDGRGIEITKKVNDGKIRVGGGSMVRVTFLINEYVTGTNIGISLRLEGVQVIKLQSSGRDAASLGFGAVDGGFSGDEIDEDSDGDAGDSTPAGKTDVDLDDDDGDDSGDAEYASKNAKPPAKTGKK